VQQGREPKPQSCPSTEQVGAVPIPLRDTICGLPGALSVTKTVPLKLSGLLGVKVTLMSQFAPDARVKPQVLNTPKSALPVILAMLRVEVPELLNVTLCAALVVPSGSAPKVKLVGDKVTLGDPPSDPPPQPLSRHNPHNMSGRYFFIMSASFNFRLESCRRHDNIRLLGVHCRTRISAGRLRIAFDPFPHSRRTIARLRFRSPSKVPANFWQTV